MVNDLHLVILPEPDNQGEDLNWQQFTVIGHTDPTLLSKPVIQKLVNEFFSLPIMNEDSDEWEDLYTNEKIPIMCDFFEQKGYTVFPNVQGIRWVVSP